MRERERTHWEDCWRSHVDCAAVEVERLREALAEAVELIVQWQSGGSDQMRELYEHSPEMKRLRAVLGGK